MDKKERNQLIGNIVTITVAVILYFLYRAAFDYPELVEKIYSRGFFKVVNGIFSTITGIAPFSIAEFVLYAFCVSIIVYVIHMIVALIIGEKRLLGLVRRIVGLIAIFAGVVTAFIIMWGLNYARLPLAKSMELETVPVTKEVLYEVCLDLAEEANMLRTKVRENKAGVFVSSYTREEALGKVPEIYEAIAKKRDMEYFAGGFGRPKGVLFSEGLSYAGISGVYFPFTGEANVNTHGPMLTFFANACHEAAHQRGFAREDEANFIAYFMCRESGDADFAYSGTVHALIYAANALYETDAGLHGKLTETYSEALRRDLDAYSAYWNRYEGETAEAVETMNNTYLQSNMQEDGVRSYGRMVDLVIALYKAENSN